MSKLSQKALDEFKKNFRETRGIELTDEQADAMGWRLLKLAALSLKPKAKNRSP